MRKLVCVCGGGGAARVACRGTVTAHHAAFALQCFCLASSGADMTCHHVGSLPLPAMTAAPAASGVQMDQAAYVTCVNKGCEGHLEHARPILSTSRDANGTVSPWTISTKPHS
jgi:hypothetical protein